jgi:hypothetical protein
MAASQLEMSWGGMQKSGLSGLRARLPLYKSRAIHFLAGLLVLQTFASLVMLKLARVTSSLA